MSDHTSPETRLENIESTLNCIAESLERLVIAADSIATALSLQALASPPAKPAPVPVAWQCVHCRFFNVPAKVFCINCEKRRTDL
jgi:hypothetical protein